MIDLRSGPGGPSFGSDHPRVDRQAHWQHVYRTKPGEGVSWYETEPRLSLDFIQACGLGRGDPILDVGGGTSFLVDHLLDLGFEDVSVLDISGVALERTRQRLGQRATSVEWIESDITTFEPTRTYGLWHDRAVFHFLREEDDQAAYSRCVRRSVRPGGWAIVAAFAPDGPIKCSGLFVQRHDADSMGQMLGPSFRFVEEARQEHTTPSGVIQRFAWARFQRES